MTLERVSDDMVNIFWTGCTWAFRIKFDRFDVGGGYLEGDAEQRDYVRMLLDVSISDEDAFCKLSLILGDNVLSSFPVLLVDDTGATEGTKLHDFIMRIRNLPSVHVR